MRGRLWWVSECVEHSPSAKKGVMQAGKPADMSVLDLVEEFQALDVDDMMKGEASAKGRFGSISLERSIGRFVGGTVDTTHAYGMWFVLLVLGQLDTGTVNAVACDALVYAAVVAVTDSSVVPRN